MELRTGGITREIIVAKSPYLPGVDVIEVPGLGYFASVESAQEALDKLARGVCPMSHEIEPGFEPQVCRVCGEHERVADEPNDIFPEGA
ncbi:hypothetical protein [Actinomadura opuntiae]|uniref:hypothetical protein n=1 Tax=Actinomadura sp. OS1-43 TaxID=604315 RepID=UPI00255B249A|nr:hypothetical protein [Actinomadura sp. OS1-43]MDL4816941.1 hypothetical protein [Actinomadura sp. OS1-43]